MMVLGTDSVRSIIRSHYDKAKECRKRPLDIDARVIPLLYNADRSRGLRQKFGGVIVLLGRCSYWLQFHARLRIGSHCVL
jgi:hypothetical protein